ncbi:FMRFamide-related peptides [Lutzomyia longipalpis]|uniref:FMRFamide-related peptides n=1 Tax=Lutzomyia longipalpis TaxID=7200 RepID=UPI0024844F88|nr:FMRFamide-related peptides [Lutzomyia longipalpis]
MPPSTMKLILLFCTIILATHHTAAVAEVQDYELSRGSEEVDANQPPLQLHQFSQHRHVRSDNTEIEARRRSSLDKNFMRFGRADKNILRFGRPDNNFIRFGRTDKNILRFGRPDNNFIRFGRTSEFVRPLGESTERRKKAKNPKIEWNDGKQDENFMRFGRNQKTNFLRLGRSQEKGGGGGTQQNPQTKNILRFGRSENFMRFGRSGGDPAEAPNSDEFPEEAPEDVKSFLDFLPALADDESLVIPPNYLIPKEDDN